MTSKSELPSYDAAAEKAYNETKMKPKMCQHTASETTHIDAQLQQPFAKAAMRTLSDALANIADNEQCTKCATESATLALTGFLREIHDDKKSGQWSKQEQKAFKSEAKGLFKGMKGDVKSVWSNKQVGVASG
ncbi:uncharacterized protein LTR77_002794 [Saxophila tyrrhenica]|uniref:Uncharacterized protein n=1 Tax=Saxophila tyrrhenica TaxID=1690608 RepID=A0AAV9PFX9_9PEZI|nr:hypothetical protein LTR77_002794 [Saxophila tyrrhenica]